MSNGDNSLEDALRLATIGAGMSIRSDFDTRTRYSDVADTECLDEWQEGGDIQAIAADIDAVKTAATRVALEALPRRGHGDGPAYNLIHVTALKSNFKSGVPVDARKDPLHARSSDLMPGRIIGEHLAVHVNEGVAHFGVPLSFRLISEGLAVAVVDYDTSNALATRILDAQDAGDASAPAFRPGFPPETTTGVRQHRLSNMGGCSVQFTAPRGHRHRGWQTP